MGKSKKKTLKDFIESGISNRRLSRIESEVEYKPRGEVRRVPGGVIVSTYDYCPWPRGREPYSTPVHDWDPKRVRSFIKIEQRIAASKKRAPDGSSYQRDLERQREELLK